MKNIKIYIELFLAGLGLIIWGYFSVRHFYKIDVEEGYAVEQYEFDVSDQITAMYGGFMFTTLSLSKIFHALWEHERFVYLLMMLYAIFIYFIHDFVIKKLHITDKVNYYAAKIDSYIYLVVALYQFYEFVSFE